MQDSGKTTFSGTTPEVQQEELQHKASEAQSELPTEVVPEKHQLRSVEVEHSVSSEIQYGVHQVKLPDDQSESPTEVVPEKSDEVLVEADTNVSSQVEPFISQEMPPDYQSEVEPCVTIELHRVPKNIRPILKKRNDLTLHNGEAQTDISALDGIKVIFKTNFIEMKV